MAMLLIIGQRDASKSILSNSEEGDEPYLAPSFFPKTGIKV